MKEVPIREFTIQGVRLGGWAMAIVTLCLVVPNLLSDDPNYRAAILLLAIPGGPAVYCLWQVGFLEKATICYDREGVWFARLGKKDGLVRWTEVESIRERDAVQRLELLDRHGSVLIRLEHQLERYDSIKRMIQKKLRRRNSKMELPVTFVRADAIQILALGYPIFGAVLCGFFVVTSLLDGKGFDPENAAGLALFLLIFGGFGLYLHLAFPKKLVVTRDGLVRYFPLTTQRIALEQIESFEVLWKEGAKRYYEGVNLNLVGGDSPIGICKGLRMEAHDLRRELEEAVKAAREETRRRARNRSPS